MRRNVTASSFSFLSFLLLTTVILSNISTLRAEPLGEVDCGSSTTKKYTINTRSGSLGSSEADAKQKAIDSCSYTLGKAGANSAGEVDCGICLNPWGCDGSASTDVVASSVSAGGNPTCWKNSSSSSGGSGGSLGGAIALAALLTGTLGNPPPPSWTCYVDCGGDVNVTHTCTPCVGWLCDLFNDSEDKSQCESMAEEIAIGEGSLQTR